MIQEAQEESVRMCPKCPGYMTIDSTGQHRHRSTKIFGVSVPIYACKECQQEAREEYRSKLHDIRYDYIYLQDKKADRYSSYNVKTGQETLL